MACQSEEFDCSSFSKKLCLKILNEEKLRKSCYIFLWPLCECVCMRAFTPTKDTTTFIYFFNGEDRVWFINGCFIKSCKFCYSFFFQYYKGLAFNFCGNELVILLFKRPGFVSKLILTLNFTEHSAILLFSVRLESLCFLSFLRWFIASPCNLIPDNHIY